MTRPAGLSLADPAGLGSLLNLIEISFPISPPAVVLYEALQNWPGWREFQEQGGVANAMLAEHLDVSLDAGGWCLNDLFSGEVRAFRCSEIFDQMEAAICPDA